MKIAIVGGESTGKSTLATGLAKALSLPIVAPLKETILKESGYHTIFEWAAATNGWTKLLERQLDRERGLGDAVIDDGVVQLYAVVQRWGWNRLSPDAFEELRARVLAVATRYDTIVVTASALVGGSAPGRFRSTAQNAQLVRLLEALVREAGLISKTCSCSGSSADAQLQETLTFIRR